MPDLTIETAATCWSNRSWHTEVQGSGKKPYKVSYGMLSGNEEARQGAQRGWTCDCPGFIYRKDGGTPCKHVRKVVNSGVRCGWNNTLEPSLPAKIDENSGETVCPSCGGPIEYVRVAV